MPRCLILSASVLRSGSGIITTFLLRRVSIDQCDLSVCTKMQAQNSRTNRNMRLRIQREKSRNLCFFSWCCWVFEWSVSSYGKGWRKPGERKYLVILKCTSSPVIGKCKLCSNTPWPAFISGALLQKFEMWTRRCVWDVGDRDLECCLRGIYGRTRLILHSGHLELVSLKEITQFKEREKTLCKLLLCLMDIYWLVIFAQPLRVSGLLTFTFSCDLLGFP